MIPKQNNDSRPVFSQRPLFRLIILGTALAMLDTAAAEPTILRNAHLAVTFEEFDTGPRLSEIRDPKAGTAYRVVERQPLSLFVVPAETIHDPALPVTFAGVSEFAPDGIDVAKDLTRARFRYRHSLANMEITYQLDSDAPVLRKTITCTAKEKPIYVAGVRLWMLKPVTGSLIWPLKNTLGQPAIVAIEDAGYLLTFEWPRAEVTSENGEITMGYRPGLPLAPGESRELAAGSILCFQRTFQKEILDAARETFFEHVTARVKPVVPCPIKFTTWGPWLAQARADRILEIMDDLEYVGTDLFHFDAGWQWPEYPYSQRLPGLRDADDKTWDRGVTQPERLPEGLLPIIDACKKHGMLLSLWFDACGRAFLREKEEWAVRDANGNVSREANWEKRWRKAPVQSLASEYGDRLRDFVLETMKRYDLAGVMFDDNFYLPDHATDHQCLANGWDTVDIALRRIMEIFDECNRRRPGIYRFFCRGDSLPWALMHVTHIHAGDPGTSGNMRSASETDCPARALAFERRLAWKKHYDNFVPPWGVKGDIAGWSLQQASPIPINLSHTDQLISVGEGWTQNLFTCFGTTAVRDIRFSFRQMPAFDRDILKEWLAWDRGRSQFIFNCRPLFDFSRQSNTGITGFSHVGQGRGVIYLFNAGFEAAQVELPLDENAGFRPDDKAIPAFIIYPMRARVNGETLSYGQTLRAPIAGKDCLVIEVGLEAPDHPAPYADYEKAAGSIARSFDTLFRASAEEIVEAVRGGAVRIEVGKGVPDQRLAAQIAETLGAATGHRISLDECLATKASDARCRLIIGTHDGLSGHADVGKHFKETLYNRYIEWEGQLISAPLAVAMAGEPRPTFCLIAPRPEQLSRLAINLVTAVKAQATPTDAKPSEPQWDKYSITASVPAGRPVLQFRPLMKLTGALAMPNDLSLVRYEISVEHNGKRTLIWREDIPPFDTHAGPGGWWQDRLISIADFAGQEVPFHFTAAHVDGRTESPMAMGGFDHVALLALSH